MDDVVVDAKKLQQFFFKYDFDNKCEKEVREQLLAIIPIGCNYKFDPYTLVAKVTGFCTTDHNLEAHLSLKFCPGCQLTITSKWYDRLKFLGKIQGLLLGWTKSRARPESLKSNISGRFILF